MYYALAYCSKEEMVKEHGNWWDWGEGFFYVVAYYYENGKKYDLMGNDLSSDKLYFEFSLLKQAKKVGDIH